MKIGKIDFNNKRGVLLKNTIMLYILQFSTYILALAVAPYQSRVLGPEVYGGVLNASVAIIVYFQLIIDFGFLLSATEEVSRERANKGRLREIFSAVTLCKIGLALVSFVGLVVLCQLIPEWKQKETVLILTFIATFLNSLMPDYLYRGLEKMTAITIRTVLIKTFFAVAVFLFLRGPEDVWMIPALNIVGNGVALVCAYLHIVKKLDIQFAKVRVGTVFRELKQSSVFFFSRIATTAYTALNTVLLDIMSGSGAVTGYYTSADRLITVGKNGVSPIADSFYPYMAKNKDFKLVKKVLLILEPIIFVFCAVVFVFAEPFCVWFFGAEYGPTGDVLRAMLPVGVVILPSYILGFPTLTAMNLTKHANYSTVVGSCCQLVMLGVLFLTNHINMITLALSVSITETLILLYRIIIVVKYRHRMRKETDDGIAE